MLRLLVLLVPPPLLTNDGESTSLHLSKFHWMQGHASCCLPGGVRSRQCLPMKLTAAKQLQARQAFSLTCNFTIVVKFQLLGGFDFHLVVERWAQWLLWCVASFFPSIHPSIDFKIAVENLFFLRLTTSALHLCSKIVSISKEKREADGDLIWCNSAYCWVHSEKYLSLNSEMFFQRLVTPNA